jgi:hypothetical protein
MKITGNDDILAVFMESALIGTPRRGWISQRLRR